MVKTKNKIVFEKNRTIIKNADNFEPEKVFDCGQCFRFDRKADGTYFGVAKNKYIEISKIQSDVILNYCTENDYNEIFRDYFDMDFDYALAGKELAFDDVILQATEFSKGIRILHQDKWETLCSFIISQNNNIPRIKGIISNLCKTYGEPVFTDNDGNMHYSFPTAEAVARAGEKGMAELRTGFRAKYIYDAASKVASGEIDLMLPCLMAYDEGARYLQNIKGVGLKVASCVLLFAYQKYDAFPVDVWVKRILDKYYEGKVGAEYFGKYAGLAQQYLFYYERCKNNVFIN